MQRVTQTMDPHQCRAARAILGWSGIDLAERSSVSLRSIRRFEAGDEILHCNSVKLQRAFHDAGIAFEGKWGISVILSPAPGPHFDSDLAPSQEYAKKKRPVS